jgi:hypothetical protein
MVYLSLRFVLLVAVLICAFGDSASRVREAVECSSSLHFCPLLAIELLHSAICIVEDNLPLAQATAWLAIEAIQFVADCVLADFVCSNLHDSVILI